MVPLSPASLGEVDKAIRYVLREDARTSPNEIARRVDVSPSTVRNRIERPEDAGVIEASRPNRLQSDDYFDERLDGEEQTSKC